MIKIKKLVILFFLFLFFRSTAQSRLYNFHSVPLGDSIRLNFTVLQGTTSCANYQILKGSDSLSLLPIYVYPGFCGDVNFSVPYSYTDFSPNKSTPNFYQVLIPPSDYSQVLRVDLATSFSDLLISPQPVENTLNIAITNRNSYYYEINIYDRFGRKKGFGSGEVLDKIRLDVSGFAEGVYVFYIVLDDGSAFRGKFLKLPTQ